MITSQASSTTIIQAWMAVIILCSVSSFRAAPRALLLAVCCLQYVPCLSSPAEHCHLSLYPRLKLSHFPSLVPRPLVSFPGPNSCAQTPRLIPRSQSRAQTPPERRGSGDVRLIPQASLLSVENFRPPITLREAQSVVQYWKTFDYFNTMTQHFFGA